MRKRSMDELGRLSPEKFRESEKLPVIAVLENVRSAYNVGSVFRTADAFRLQAVYCCGYTAYPPHKEIKKTALGAEDTVSWKHFKTIAEAVKALRDEGFGIYAVEQAENSISPGDDLLNTDQPLAVIFGNEVTGVDAATLKLCDGCIEIPQFGMKHSLNISVAAGIVLWELSQKKLNSILIRQSQ